LHFIDAHITEYRQALLLHEGVVGRGLFLENAVTGFFMARWLVPMGVVFVVRHMSPVLRSLIWNGVLLMLDHPYVKRQQVKPDASPNCLDGSVRKIGKLFSVMLRHHNLRVITDTTPVVFFA
jgi:hypothetical protein